MIVIYVLPHDIIINRITSQSFFCWLINNYNTVFFLRLGKWGTMIGKGGTPGLMVWEVCIYAPSKKFETDLVAWK